ncbi:HD family phosphohydrolase [Singulisphaera acidiphila]|uniref:Putative domain HDIG-containing protein n=1 Tax=Singulisphaera acidiphila (strain ATCC BAA-1392 / DSM 18658 / VKM B-2454 / MOB10) TaxID=886293 RepID=L0DR82_SINAD|nr:HDIG domain-containing metalloprotein [Singulisphaera acidiphila]AGA30876.1 putative domain HDIG-containing protein [Singulisphaera acidiphila DSM 18658]
MSFGKRRSKLSRAQLRPTNPIALQQGRVARQRDRLIRLAIVGVAVLATAAIVHGSGPPFTFRIGQRPTREVRVNVPEFKRLNQKKTNTERQAEVDQVPPSMVNDPAPLRDLSERLDDLMVAIAKASSLDALPENLRASWRLRNETFEELKAATDTPERRDALHLQIAKAFAPLLRDGVLGYDTLPRHEESSRTLAVRGPGQSPKQSHRVPRERVVPERVAKPEGPVYKDFVAAFSDPRVGPLLFHLIAEKLAGTPTLTYEEPYTTTQRELARGRVEDVYDTYRQGDVLLDQDQKIEEEQLILLRLEHDKASGALGIGGRIRRVSSMILLVAALFALIGYYVVRHEPDVARDLSRVAALCGLVVTAIGLVRLLAMQPWDAELIPVAIAAMIIAIAYNPHFALMVTFALCLLTSLALGTGIDHFLVVMGGTAAGVLTLNEVRTRTKLIKVGATAALGYFLLTWATGLWQNEPIGLITSDSLWRAGWGLMAGFFLGGSLPFVENSFGIVTGISLLELGDITHPLLQELVRRAPGTHNHSITVGAIAESAAERIGAHALLVRIGAYFHDIGKMLKPHYFVENQAGAANRHANLAPAMSTLIIIGHVKDGVDLGRQHHLPERIIDLIEQHHGTTLVEYFYHEANRRNDGNPDAAAVQERAFRYPGPKPQSKEAGILMVADAVESASRTLSEPTPGRIEGLVRDLIEKRLRDGQFDECGLTLREIGEIRESLIKSLIGIYHGRVKYPEQRTA